MALPSLHLVACVAALSVACQSHPFEARPPRTATAAKLAQRVVNLTPTDVLFVIDNSGSMEDERRELARNVRAFLGAMAGAGADFHLGIVTTDVDCNVPGRRCGTAAQGYADGTASLACCQLAGASGGAEAAPPCQDAVDLGAPGAPRWWTGCDGGRLRGPRGQAPFWQAPTPADAPAWVASVQAVLSDAAPTGLGCQGSGLESGLEAARRAVACAVHGFDPAHPEICPEAGVATVNAGFIRPEADLVVIFVTDEDDCSFLEPSHYLRPADPAAAADQAAHLCSPAECYAEVGRALDMDGDGRMDWDDDYYTCTTADHAQSFVRAVDPPLPDAVSPFLAALVAAKGGDVTRVRAAGILGGMADPQAVTGLRAAACTGIGALGASSQCSCWSASAVVGGQNPYCAVTQVTGGRGAPPSPAQTRANECSSVGAGAVGSPALPGCSAMPGGRYVDFLGALAQARVAAMAQPTTFAASICDGSYSETLLTIVNTVILGSCYRLAAPPPALTAIHVAHNGTSLAPQPPGSATPGFSWVPGSRDVCLTGGVRKSLGDLFEVLVQADL